MKIEQISAETQDKIFGIVIKLVFQNLETAFCIAQIKLLNQQKNEVTVTGIMPGIAVSQKVTCFGSWNNHPKFGLQFVVTSFEFALPNEAQAIEKYLASGLIKGIGPALAQRLVSFFGDQTLHVLDTAPHKVLLVPGIGKNKAESIIEAWTAQREISRIMLFLRGHDVPVWLAHKIYARYQDKSIHKITTDPYSLVAEMQGVGFKTADALALKLGLALNSEKRLQSALQWALRETMQNGDLYLLQPVLLQKAVEMLQLADEDFALLEQQLASLIIEEKVVATERPEGVLICLPIAIGSERSIATHIKRLQAHQSSLDLNLPAVFAQLTTDLPKLGFAPEFELSDLQKEAVLAALSHKVSVITGGPGTGKTTLLKALCGVLKSQNIKFKLAAPTGRAAKRISESTRLPALTIHRLLEYDPSIGKFKCNLDNTLDTTFLIVDEASMIDVFLALGVLKSLKNNAHLLFLGDVDQLPSVGPGNFLADLIDSNQLKTVRLNNIFRQAAGSGIVRSAHAVNQAQMPERGSFDSDFMFLSAPEPEDLQALLTKVVQKILPAKGISPADWIVLSPMHRGAAGCQALNFYLQRLLNPNALSGEKITNFGQDFCVGDRVMQVRNNYDKNVFNGDIGTVKALDVGNKALSVQFFEREVLYKTFELEQLILAYAVSIHKSQGSEFAAVTIPIFTQHFMLLSKKLLYTAITRAKKLCVLLGQTKALAIAVKSQKSLQRVTLLRDFLQ